MKNTTRISYLLMQFSFVFISLFFLVGCSRSKSGIDLWRPQTKLLDQFSEANTNKTVFVNSVKGFYDNLHLKNWSAVYRQRDHFFQEDVSEQTFIEIANKETAEYSWGLLNYQILSISSQEPNKIVLICKFIEAPSGEETYGSVAWKMENGLWRCDKAGPIEISVLQNMRGN